MTHASASSPAAGKAGNRRAAGAAAIVCLLYLAGVLPIILLGLDRGRGAVDQDLFHLKAIRLLAGQWPHPRFDDYPSATTPGFHVALAAVAHYIGDGLRTLRLAGLLFSLGWLITLAIVIAKRVNSLLTAVVLCLPIVCCVHVVFSGAWLLPDNAGWWGVLGVLLIALRPRVDGWTYVAGGAILLLLVLVRQSHAWAAAPLLVAASLGNGEDAAVVPSSAGQLKRIVLMVLAILPSALALGYLFHLWHGTVPPSLRDQILGGNPAGPVLALAVVGAWGLFYVPMLVRSIGPRGEVYAIAGGVIGLIIAMVPRTTYDIMGGRFSGFWNFAAKFPALHGRSMLMVGLATLGGLVLGLAMSVMTARQRWIWLATAVAFAAAQVTNHFAFQRYDEPLVLMAAALIISSLRMPLPRVSLFGPVVLSMILLWTTVLALR